MTLARQAGDECNPYADAAMRYRRSGWGGPLPLPYSKKEKPPIGFTGEQAPYPTVEKIEEWQNAGRQNICLRLAGVDADHEIIGIDVDQYTKGNKQKRGFDQLQELVKTLGPLPDTWISSSRTDGKSGIRFYRVPRGLSFAGKVDDDVEVIRKGHRYAVVWPSVHPDGMAYWWFPPGHDPDDVNKDVWNGDLPDPRTFEKLPDPWIDFLTNHRTLASADLSDDKSRLDEIYGWADETFHGDDDSPPCVKMREKLTKHIEKVRDSSTFHDLLTNAHWNLFKLASEGHHGWVAAVNQYEQEWVKAVIARGGGTTDRSPETLRQEVFRSRSKALRKLKALDKPVLSSCEIVGCVGDMANVISFPNLETGETMDQDEQPETIFRKLGPTDWAQPVATTRFLIKRVLSTDTWGVNGGPEKSLKTHDNQAIGLAVATGSNLYNDARFTVERPGKVVYIVGEGGENQVRRTLHRMLRAYGVKPEDVARDPDFPFVVFFGAAPLDSYRLREELKSVLDEHQPSLVLMESFYNFHPDVNAANLYERGQVIDSYHKLVRSGGSDVVSLLTDHNKKGANELGLRQISMAGQAENSDSWIQRKHRTDPDVQSGEFQLTTSFNGRDWGGNVFDIDWHLGAFDHDANAHVGLIDWDVTDHGAVGGTQTRLSTLRADIAALIHGNPWRETRTSLKTKLPNRNQDITDEIARMLADSVIEEDAPKNHGITGKAMVFGPGPSMSAVASKLVLPVGVNTP
ncbi:bifunctional DNA primase/polymerase [Mycolicibacterium porcinum]|uniref:Bifunctional DNA primase/polymerase n=1 Tax=Mycolicibacterium porcinum TaxID=39693 RepID=A0ABV3VK08_9MYCO